MCVCVDVAHREVDEKALQACCSQVAKWLVVAKDGDKLTIQQNFGMLYFFPSFTMVDTDVEMSMLQHIKFGTV